MMLNVDDGEVILNEHERDALEAILSIAESAESETFVTLQIDQIYALEEHATYLLRAIRRIHRRAST
jgi:hypothetical protein